MLSLWDPLSLVIRFGTFIFIKENKDCSKLSLKSFLTFVKETESFWILEESIVKPMQTFVRKRKSLEQTPFIFIMGWTKERNWKFTKESSFLSWFSKMSVLWKTRSFKWMSETTRSNLKRISARKWSFCLLTEKHLHCFILPWLWNRIKSLSFFRLNLKEYWEANLWSEKIRPFCMLKIQLCIKADYTKEIQTSLDW